MCPLMSAPYYWAICDACGVNMQECSDFAAWSQSDVALDVVTDQGGKVVNAERDATTIVCGDCLEDYYADLKLDEDATQLHRELVDDEDTGVLEQLAYWARVRGVTRS